MTGWPRAVSRPGLPQTRTCAINAFGSSSNTFASTATKRRRGTRFAIRWACVDTQWEVNASLVFPSSGVVTRRPASLPRVQVGASSPASTVLSGRYDFLPPISPRFVAFAWRYHWKRSCFARPRPNAIAGGSPGVGHPVPPAGSASVETTGSPTFLGNPLVLLPCSPTPAGPTHQALAMRRRGPRYVHGEGSRIAAFEAQSHGFGTGCLRFAGRVTPTPRKTRFRLLARLFRTGLVTRRVPSKGFRVYPTSHPPFPSST